METPYLRNPTCSYINPDMHIHVSGYTEAGGGSAPHATATTSASTAATPVGIMTLFLTRCAVCALVAGRTRSNRASYYV